MLKGLIILENGFEDSEALVTNDLLKRAGIKMDNASIYKRDIVSQSGIKVTTDMLLKDIKNLSDYSFLVLPGGRAVFEVLDKSKEIDDLIDYFYLNKKMICAICAAPLLIGKRGYFKNLKYTCFPGCEEKITSGERLNQGVVSDGMFVCAKAAYYSTSFALEIVKRLNLDNVILEERFKGNL